MIEPHRRDHLPGLGAPVALAVHRPAVAAELDLEQHVVGPPREAVHRTGHVRGPGAHLHPVGEGRDLSRVERAVHQDLHAVGAALRPAHPPPQRAPLERDIVRLDVRLGRLQHVHRREAAGARFERSHGEAVVEPLQLLGVVDHGVLVEDPLMCVLPGRFEAELLERLPEHLLAAAPAEEPGGARGPPPQPRRAHQIREGIRRLAEQLLERRDHAERLVPAGQAPPGLPVAQGGHADRTVPRPQPLRDRGQRQPAALDRPAQLRREPLVLVRCHLLGAPCICSTAPARTDGHPPFNVSDIPLKSQQ